MGSGDLFDKSQLKDKQEVQPKRQIGSSAGKRSKSRRSRRERNSSGSGSSGSGGSSSSSGSSSDSGSASGSSRSPVGRRSSARSRSRSSSLSSSGGDDRYEPRRKNGFTTNSRMSAHDYGRDGKRRRVDHYNDRERDWDRGYERDQNDRWHVMRDNYRRRSRSPLSSRYSRSPPMRPGYRSPSPRRRMSPSPRRRMSPSPRRRMSPSPRRRMSPSPRRRMSPSPRRRMSPSPRRRMSMSPPRRRMSPSPRAYRRSRSPGYNRSPSPWGRGRRRSTSPQGRRSPPGTRSGGRGPGYDPRRSMSPPRHHGSPSRQRFHAPIHIDAQPHQSRGRDGQSRTSLNDQQVDPPTVMQGPHSGRQSRSPPYNNIQDRSTRISNEREPFNGRKRQQLPLSQQTTQVPHEKISPPCHPEVKSTTQATKPKAVTSWGTGCVDLYEKIEKVGQGTYGEVFKAREKATNTIVALKKVLMDHEREGFPITAIREIKILRQMQNENIVCLRGIVTDAKDPTEHTKVKGAFYMVFEYMEHDLTGILEGGKVRLTADNIRNLMRCLLEGIHHCHQRGMLHRDIKASNLLLNNKGQLKIADFGLARRYDVDEQRAYTNRVITLWYRPPELLLGNELYGPEVDMWSIGCILGELYNRRPIFRGDKEIDVLEAISRICGTPSVVSWPSVNKCAHFNLFSPTVFKKPHPRVVKDFFGSRFDVPADGLDLLDQLLTLDPSKRLTSVKALSHPFIRPELCQPFVIDIDQDCHEMWVKQERRKAQAAQAAVVQRSQSKPMQPLHDHQQAQILTK